MRFNESRLTSNTPTRIGRAMPSGAIMKFVHFVMMRYEMYIVASSSLSTAFQAVAMNDIGFVPLDCSRSCGAGMGSRLALIHKPMYERKNNAIGEEKR